MKLLIDIPEEDYKYIKSNGSIYYSHVHDIINGIIHGKKLPETYGRLIDADALNKDLEKWWIDTTHQPKTIVSVYEDVLRNIRMADTIIEREIN